MTDELFPKELAKPGAIECLGLTFASDEARRAYFVEKLREKLKDPAFRKIEGFPIGDDEDILRISDPPYYTACPNPWLSEFVERYGKPYDPETDRYRREPLAVDVSEGKTDPIYTAHGYHTKVPHKAIMRAILHYTEPGDLVLDGFAGSGMTGVAAQMCGSPDAEFRGIVEAEWKAAGRTPPVWGARRAILNDLSPAATFIAGNYNLPFDVDAFEQEAQRLLRDLDRELGWMYETLHTDGKTRGRINYTVWSEVFGCPHCGAEVVFYEQALDPKTKRVREIFPCPRCGADLVKDSLQRLFDTTIDPATGEPTRRIRLVPVLVNYDAGGSEHEKKPDLADRQLIGKVAALPLPASVPTTEFPIDRMYHGSRLAPKGFSRVHHLYLPRAAQALGSLWAKAAAVEDPRCREMILFFVEQAIWGMSVLARYAPTHYSQVNQYLTGVYYVASQHSEVSPWYILGGKLRRLASVFREFRQDAASVSVTTGDAALLDLPSDTVDYVFTDPPFGENIYYADLNYLVESWHRVWTNAVPEAIVDQAKHKGLPEYQRLMQRCFEEYARVLKPGRWLTVVFHNSRNSVWNAIQEAMLAAGFVVADVRTLDKQQGSYRQVTSSAVKQDLVISAYKPNNHLEERFRLEAGTPEGAWDFVRTHLRQLPVFAKTRAGRAEVIAERLTYLLFDRMVAFHVLRGVSVPLSASEFTEGLRQRFPERDGMFFLPDQAAEYDRQRAEVAEVEQLQIFITDESSAIQWLRQQLAEEPHTFQELHPRFMRDIAGWSRWEKPLELAKLLGGSFFRYQGEAPVPDQIWAWLLKSGAVAPERLAREGEAALKDQVEEVARDRWYVPDPNKAQDLERLRERTLLREFDEYRAFTGRQLKVFRLEAVRTGFKKAWAARDYPTILDVARKVPLDVLQEDQKLLMWYDQAMTRTGRSE